MVIELLTSHASVRKYKDIALSKEEVHELIRAGQHAASFALCPSILCHLCNGC